MNNHTPDTSHLSTDTPSSPSPLLSSPLSDKDPTQDISTTISSFAVSSTSPSQDDPNEISSSLPSSTPLLSESLPYTLIPTSVSSTPLAPDPLIFPSISSPPPVASPSFPSPHVSSTLSSPPATPPSISSSPLSTIPLSSPSPSAPLPPPSKTSLLEEEPTFEQLLEVVGTNGCWNYMVFGLCALAAFAPPLQSMSYQFLGVTPNHWCLVPTLIHANWTQQQILDLAIPYNTETGKRESCWMYDYNYTLAAEVGYQASIGGREMLLMLRRPGEEEEEGGGGTTTTTITTTLTRPCNTRYFNATHPTTVTQWDLVCERRVLYATTFSAAFIVRLASALFQGVIIDTFGRRGIGVGASLLFVVCGGLAAVAPSLHIYLLLRALITLFDMLFYLSCYVLSVEVCSNQQRSMMGNLFAVPWALGQMVMAGLAYLVRDWRYLQVAFTLPALSMLSYYWLLPESPRWLLTKGRVGEAAVVLKKAARMNGTQLPSDQHLLRALTHIKNRMKRDKQETKPSGSDAPPSWWKKMVVGCWGGWGSVKGLIDTPRLLVITLVVLFMWFSSSIIYYGVSLNSVNLSTDQYLYMFLGGVLEVPSYLLLWPMVAHFGRRNTNMALYFVCAASLLLISLLQAVAPQTPHEVKVVLSLCGKLVITSAFQLVYLYTGELYPTSHRSLALSLGGLFSGLGGFIVPYVNDVLVLEVWWGPSVLFGVLALTATLLTLLLPETNLRDLPDTDTDLHTTNRQHSYPC